MIFTAMYVKYRLSIPARTMPQTPRCVASKSTRGCLALCCSGAKMLTRTRTGCTVEPVIVPQVWDLVIVGAGIAGCALAFSNAKVCPEQSTEQSIH